jgi:hypothetical protein
MEDTLSWCTPPFSIYLKYISFHYFSLSILTWGMGDQVMGLMSVSYCHFALPFLMGGGWKVGMGSGGLLL